MSTWGAFKNRSKQEARDERELANLQRRLAEMAQQRDELLHAWDVFYTNLPDGEYRGLGELRIIMGVISGRLAAAGKEEGVSNEL